ncbi:hypothetical protein MASR2M54_06070 [Aliarcobacter cryaerophilus]
MVDIVFKRYKTTSSKNYKEVPSNLIEAIVKSNSTRKDFIADSIISRNLKVVGIYRLCNEIYGSDNFR